MRVMIDEIPNLNRLIGWGRSENGKLWIRFVPLGKNDPMTVFIREDCGEPEREHVPLKHPIDETKLF